jgi:hypothetical protein
MSEEERWCPTQSGNTTAYEPQFREGAYAKGKAVWGDWEHIPINKNFSPGKGVPYPLCMGGVFATVGLYGYEQAQALAWIFAAQAKAEGAMMETRVVAYELKYDIKARKLPESSTAAEEQSGGKL